MCYGFIGPRGALKFVETTVKPAPGSENPITPTAALSGGGDLGKLMRSLDWSQTPLGAVEEWPQSLRTSASICLASRFPIVLYWGKELVVLYNDAYSQILGSKHPWALGRTCRVCWAEIWDTIGPMLDGVLRTGEATWSDDLLLMLERFGYPEECYFSFSFSPVRVESGEVGGVFTAVIETTEKVIGERRLRTLGDLATHGVAAKSEEDAWQMAAATLGENAADIPFAVLCQAAGEELRLVATAGISSEHPFCEELRRAGSGLFQMAIDAAGKGRRGVLTEMGTLFGDLPSGPWRMSPRSAVVLPIAALGQGPSGVLVAAASPAKALDDSYNTFFELVARQIATGIADARSHEEERRRAEELAALDRARTLFFSNVSHELRTPLTLLLGPTEGALASPDRALRGADLELLYRNELRLLKLVNMLLEFSRLEAGRVQASYEPTSLGEFTAEIASVFRSAMEKAGLTFTVDCQPLGEPVWVDRVMWEQIVLNLLSNAFKFTLEGEVAVSLRAAHGSVELSIRDTGAGIPQEEIPRLFERFHRVETTRARTQEGSGIGLALVQELVRLHRGTVHVQSVAGEGSTFTVSIPLGMAHLPADRLGAVGNPDLTALGAASFIAEAQRWLPGELEEAANEEMASGLPSLVFDDNSPEDRRRDKVLVVDDNRDMREYLCRLLAHEYQVHSAANGAEAFELAARMRPALILSDVMMPELDGFALLQAVRSDRDLASTPVILLSARAGEESRIEGLEAGADDYLVKPFTARELLSRVGSHLRMAAMRREATEREARLRAEAENERRRLQNLLAQAPAAIGLMSGPEHRWVYVNDLYVRVTGCASAADLLGKTIRESLPELRDSGFWELLDEVYRTGQPYSGHEMRASLRAAPGAEVVDKYFDFVYQPLSDPEGRIEGILVHAVEVTARVQARTLIEQNHAQLKAAHITSQRLAAIVESSSDAIVSKDLNGCVTSWNPCAERMFGYAADEMIGRSILTIIPPELHADEERILATIRSGRRIEHFETVRVTKSGERIDVSLSISPVRDETGSIVGASKIVRDITQRKRAEHALRTTEKLASVGRLAATVAHEINNPLESVTNLVYLARESSDQESVRNFLATAEEELARVAVLTRQTLGFYRDTKAPTSVKLGDLVGPLVSAFQPRARNKAVRVDTEIREQRPVRGLAGEIRQVMANLLTNSLDAVPSQGRVRIRIRDAREWSGKCRAGVRLTIADNGSGIAPGLRQNLFEPFFTTKKDVGTGLGLWVCRAIVEKHEGSIRLRSSTREGRTGTTFSVFFPIAEAVKPMAG